jgi:hypothetical protein
LTFADKAGTVHLVRVSRPELVKVMQSLARHSHVRIAFNSETTVVVARKGDIAVSLAAHPIENVPRVRPSQGEHPGWAQ